MAHRWAETFSRNTALGTSAAISVALHAGLITAAVIATAYVEVQQTDISEVSIATFLAPPNREGGQKPQQEMIKFVARGTTEAPPPTHKPLPIDDKKGTPEPVLSGFDVATSPPKEEIKGADSVFTLIEVDSAATRYAWSAAPAYPPSMLDLKRDGFVKAQWVVDEDGYADTTSLKIVEYTAPEFAKAVRDALPFMRFSPARIGNQRVKQLVEQGFTFPISTVISPPGTKKPPT